MNRGYSGFYKGIFLRSSYEYAFAKYLDFHEIEWKYEERYYKFGDERYIPDFFIYEGQKFVRVVEVKSKVKNELEKAKTNFGKLKQSCGIDGELVSYEELKKLYEKMPCSITSTIREWNKSSKTSISKSVKGELNAHFGLRHSFKTKQAIGFHTKSLWETNEEAKNKMLEGAKKGAQKAKQKLTGTQKVQRESRKCKHCKEEFVVKKSSPAEFCGRRCANGYIAKDAIELRWRNQKNVHNKLKEHAMLWCFSNRKLVEETPLNKISTTLRPLLNEIESRFGIKDMRIIAKAITGEQNNRKALLEHLKREIGT